jgi:hypothetical protein
MLPNTIIIGAMKCGTTSFCKYLRAHPDIFLPKKAEIEFFSEGFPRNSLGYYESLFKCREKVVVDNSPGYSMVHKYKAVAERIYSTLPSAKIIYLVRNPIDRLHSHYTHSFLLGKENSDFYLSARAEIKKNHYISTSRYFSQLNEYLKFFNNAKIKLIQAEELRNDRKKTIQKVFKFLKVNPEFWHKDYDISYHQSSLKGKKNIIGKIIYKLRLSKKIKPFIPEIIERHFKKITEHNYSIPDMPREVKEKIIEHLEADIMKLESYTGWDLSHWRKV